MCDASPSRWLQAPLYLGLIVAQALYVWQFMVELWHLGDTIVTGHVSAATIKAFGRPDSLPGPEVIVMLAVLGLIDVVMISNLLIMVIIGGYETFVSRIRPQGPPRRARVALPRQRQRAQGETGDRHHRDLVGAPAPDVHQGQGHALADHDVADDHASGVRGLGHRAGLHRSAAVRLTRRTHPRARRPLTLRAAQRPAEGLRAAITPRGRGGGRWRIWGVRRAAAPG